MSQAREKAVLQEILRGVVQRVTYHNPVNGWSVLKVQPYGSFTEQVAVIVHQTKVFAGATMEFCGQWQAHAKFGRQFRAETAVERKPASAAALEKYLGSGLIKGVGPKTARKIVGHFGKETLKIFEENIDRLTEVEGIARKKLAMISAAWTEHRQIRDVMMFLQQHNISTLFAIRIFKKYGAQAIELVRCDPYRLAVDFYGIGFFSADQVALSLGFAPDSRERSVAGIRHILGAAREQGHCYLTEQQVSSGVSELLNQDVADHIPHLLEELLEDDRLKVRYLDLGEGELTRCYYAKALYYAEQGVAQQVGRGSLPRPVDKEAIAHWIEGYCRARGIQLSTEQARAAFQVAGCSCSVLTGGPGCGKTTTTLVIVRLLEHLGMSVLLAAPTGRAAQRMGEVIGREAKTLHRLLEWQQGVFTRNEERPLEADFIIVDECSMLDISLTASLFRAVPDHCQVLLIGDADQLPSVGAGNVLGDIIASGRVPVFRLTEIFRQARESSIIRFSHQINTGRLPAVPSPFKFPELWKNGADCMFFDSDEATREQIDFVTKVKKTFTYHLPEREALCGDEEPYEFRSEEQLANSYEQEFIVPEKFRYVDLQQVVQATNQTEELTAVLKKIHPWSTLHYGLSALDTVVRLYTEWIPRYYGADCEIQVLAPMTRGSLGTVNLNTVIQQKTNPPAADKAELQLGERTFRVGDRVIHRRNNYDLGVFNGDIGRITAIDAVSLGCIVTFFPDNREVCYQRDDIVELDLAYAITVHKSQGSEFQVVILPVLTQHFTMLYRNLIYTGLTRARKLAVFVGTRRALSMAVQRQDTSKRQTALAALLATLP